MADYDEKMMKTTMPMLLACLWAVPMVGAADEAAGKAPEKQAQSIQAGVHGDPLKDLHDFKGIECYKVKVGGEVRYYLLSGTNRNKSVQEIVQRPGYYTDFRLMLSFSRALKGMPLPFLMGPANAFSSGDLKEDTAMPVKVLSFTDEERQVHRKMGASGAGV
ncbi:Hypothetical protein PYTT_0831 [Akkermansia glycaniphila]|uniref:Uncharacterized protein n=2 Tax=Akkermansia glycaniphila TaxID=1679444 RepID=A0A1C7PDF7_9BACT|nr:hypothetical protein AC781_03500 [Akkermansia glycaniphila]SEH79851.1 Hypothetical protein PYTT_0831 [Akkermansia glycaniphila]